MNLTRFGGSYHKSSITYEKMAQDDWGELSTLSTKAGNSNSKTYSLNKLVGYFNVYQTDSSPDAI